MPTKTQQQNPDTAHLKPPEHAIYGAPHQALSCGDAPSVPPPSVVGLIGREQEAYKIWSFIWKNIQQQSSGFLSLTGKPGTGKSATLSLLGRQLTSFQNKNNSKFTARQLQSNFVLAFCNCINYTAGKEADFWKDLLLHIDNDVGEIARVNDSKAKVEDLLFQNSKISGYSSIIIVLDEVDLLEKQKWGRQVLERMIAWTKPSSSKLILVGCGNTIADITRKTNSHASSGLLTSSVRLMSTRTRSASTLPVEKSRDAAVSVVDLAVNEVIVRFEPYTADQIAAIIENELENNTNNENDNPISMNAVAKQFLAKRIANCNGDLRQAKDALRLTVASLQQEEQERCCATEKMHATFDPPQPVSSTEAEKEQKTFRAVSPDRSRRPSPYINQNSPSPRKPKQRQQHASRFETPTKIPNPNAAEISCSPLANLQLRTPIQKPTFETSTKKCAPIKEIGVFDIVKTLDRYAPQAGQMLHKSKQTLSLKQKIMLFCFLCKQNSGNGRSYSFAEERFSLTFAELCDKYREACSRVKLLGSNESETELFNMVEMLDGLGFLQIEPIGKFAPKKAGTPLKRFYSTGSMVKSGGGGGGSIRQRVIVLRSSHRDIENVIDHDKKLFESIVS